MSTLDGRIFRVASTAGNGVVDAGTRLQFIQRGARILARYAGGSICRGVLAGELSSGRLSFHFLQRESTGELHGGGSTCEVSEMPDGRLRIIEHFAWRTRVGSGTNVFEEIRHE
jgi:hypothetical protein